MIGFEPQDAKRLGSEGRFYARIEKFEKAGKRFPKTQHLFWWVTHNAIAHTLLAICPMRWSFRFHDWTSLKLNAIPPKPNVEELSKMVG